MPCWAHVVGVHVAPPHSATKFAPGGSVTTPQHPCIGAHTPQPAVLHRRKSPHPSETGVGMNPQNAGAPGPGEGGFGGGCSAHVFGMQTGAAHELHSPGTPAAPHTSPLGQAPQSSQVPHTGS